MGGADLRAPRNHERRPDSGLGRSDAMDLVACSGRRTGCRHLDLGLLARSESLARCGHLIYRCDASRDRRYLRGNEIEQRIEGTSRANARLQRSERQPSIGLTTTALSPLPPGPSPIVGHNVIPFIGRRARDEGNDGLTLTHVEHFVRYPRLNVDEIAGFVLN